VAFFSAVANVLVRIVKPPTSADYAPFDLSRFEIGKVYEIGPKLAELLILNWCAEFTDQPRSDSRSTPRERR